MVLLLVGGNYYDYYVKVCLRVQKTYVHEVLGLETAGAFMAMQAANLDWVRSL